MVQAQILKGFKSAIKAARKRYRLDYCQKIESSNKFVKLNTTLANIKSEKAPVRYMLISLLSC